MDLNYSEKLSSTKKNHFTVMSHQNTNNENLKRRKLMTENPGDIYNEFSYENSEKSPLSSKVLRDLYKATNLNNNNHYSFSSQKQQYIKKEENSIWKNVIRRKNIYTGESEAYASAMKALQEKIRYLENELCLLKEENENLAKNLEKETTSNSKTMNHNSEIEFFKENEKQMKESLKLSEKELTELRTYVIFLEKEKILLGMEIDKGVEENLKNKEKINKIEETLLMEKTMHQETKVLLRDLEQEKEELKLEIKSSQQKNDRIIEESTEIHEMYENKCKNLSFRNDFLEKELTAIGEHYNGQLIDFKNELFKVEEVYQKRVCDLEKFLQNSNNRVEEIEIELAVKEKKFDSLQKNFEGKDKELLQTNRLYEEITKRCQILENDFNQLEKHKKKSLNFLFLNFLNYLYSIDLFIK